MSCTLTIMTSIRAYKLFGDVKYNRMGYYMISLDIYLYDDVNYDYIVPLN